LKRAACVQRRTPALALPMMALVLGALWLAHGAPGAQRLEPQVQRRAGEFALHAASSLRAAAGAVTAHYVQGRVDARR
jgi:hypothetical protein